MISGIVTLITLIVAAFVIVWWRRPDLRAWIEGPKHRFLDQQSRFEEDERKHL